MQVSYPVVIIMPVVNCSVWCLQFCTTVARDRFPCCEPGRRWILSLWAHGVLSWGCPDNLWLSWHFYPFSQTVFAHNLVSLLLFLQKSRSNWGNYPEHYTRTGERWIHDPSCGDSQYVFVLCKMLRDGVHLQVVSSVVEQICQGSSYFIHLKIDAYYIIWLPKQFMCLQAMLVLLKGPGPFAAGTATCLLVCLPVFWSPPSSLNSTFLCSMKALHSKDLTAQEWVLLPFLSSFFSLSHSALCIHSFCSLLPGQKLFCSINRAGQAGGL